MSPQTSIAVASAAIFLTIGCGKAPPSSCDTVGDHYYAVIHAAVKKLQAQRNTPAPDKAQPADGDKATENQSARESAAATKRKIDQITAMMAGVPKVRSKMVAQCKRDKWSAELRSCFLDAPDLATMKENCGSKVPTEPQSDTDTAKPDAAPNTNAPPTSPSDPRGSGQ